MDDISSEPLAPLPDKLPTPKSSFTVYDDLVDASGLSDAQVGQVFTATVKFKVTSAAERDSGKDKSCEIESISDVMPAADEGGDEDPSLEGAVPGIDSEETSLGSTDAAEPETDADKAEEKMLGFKRPKSKKPSFPVKGLTD